MEKKVYMYLYYGVKDAVSDGELVIDPQKGRFDKVVKKMKRKGHTKKIDYAGLLNCTCAQHEDFGRHYGIILVGTLSDVFKIINDINHDYDYFEFLDIPRDDKEMGLMAV